MKKKILMISIIVLAILLLTLVGCSDKNPDGNKGDNIEVTATPEGSGIEDSVFGDETEDTVNTDGDKSTSSPKPTTISADNKKKTPAPSATPKPSSGSGNIFTGTPGKEENNKPEYKVTEAPTATPGKSENNPGTEKMDYASYKALSPKEQRAYMESFEDMDAFFEWYNAEKDKYEKENPSIEIDGGVIDLDEIVNGKK